MKFKNILAVGLVSLSIIASASAQTTPSGATRAAFNKLVADTQAALADSNVTPAQFQQLKADVWIVVDGANKPDPVLVQKLTDTIKAAKADGKITEKEKAQIYSAFMKVLTSANVPLVEVQAVKADLLAIASSANVTPDEMALIIADIQALMQTLPTPPIKP